MWTCACARNFLNLGMRRINLGPDVYGDIVNFEIYLSL